MTAQVAIYTSSCVVLAADSAVTISGPENDRRVYNGAEKIYPLSHRSPIAALVYGAASLADVPWASLLHACCAERDFDQYDIAEVASALTDFLEERLATHLRDHADAMRDRRAFGLLKALWDEACFDAAKHLEGHSQDSGPRVFASHLLAQLTGIVERESAAWSSQLRTAGLSKNEEKAQVRAFRQWAHEHVTALYSEVADIDATATADTALVEDTVDLLLLSFTRRPPEGFESSERGGVVITGFGHNDFWPGYVVVEFDGIGLSGIRTWPGRHGQTEGPNDASIQAFAQSSGVATLMDGIHPRVRNMLGSAMLDAGLTSKQAAETFEAVSGTWYENRTVGILETLDLMPAPALCEIAESLVAITALEHRLTGSLETVGGTISVAILVPGEPLRWAKRPSLMSA